MHNMRPGHVALQKLPTMPRKPVQSGGMMAMHVFYATKSTGGDLVVDHAAVTARLHLPFRSIEPLFHSCEASGKTMCDLVTGLFMSEAGRIYPDPDVLADRVSGGVPVQECLNDGFYRYYKDHLAKACSLSSSFSRFKRVFERTIAMDAIIELPVRFFEAIITTCRRVGKSMPSMLGLLLRDELDQSSKVPSKLRHAVGPRDITTPARDDQP